jgi:hypothetical protein
MLTVAIRALELEYLVKILNWGQSQSQYIFTDSDSDSTQNSFRLRLHSHGHCINKEMNNSKPVSWPV